MPQIVLCTQAPLMSNWFKCYPHFHAYSSPAYARGFCVWCTTHPAVHCLQSVRENWTDMNKDSCVHKKFFAIFLLWAGKNLPKMVETQCSGTVHPKVCQRACQWTWSACKIIVKLTRCLLFLFIMEETDNLWWNFHAFSTVLVWHINGVQECICDWKLAHISATSKEARKKEEEYKKSEQIYKR